MDNSTTNTAQAVSGELEGCLSRQSGFAKLPDALRAPSPVSSHGEPAGGVSSFVPARSEYPYQNHKNDRGFILFYGDEQIGAYADCTDMIRAKHAHEAAIAGVI